MRSASAPVWLHFDYTNTDTRSWLHSSSGLNPIVIDTLLSEETRPRATTMGNGIILTLRGLNLNPHSDPEDMVSIRLWIEPDLIISSRARRLLSVSNLYDQLSNGAGPTTVGGLITDLIGRLVDRMSDTVLSLEDRVAEVEEQILTGAIARQARTELAQLRRQIITIRRYLAPQREALNRLGQEQLDWLSDRQRLLLREVNDRQIRYIEDLDATRERAAVAQEELVSQISEQMNNRMYLLSIVAAVFLPLGFLTGLMGINVGGIPGSDEPVAFPLFVAFIIILISLQIAYFRWKKWF